MRVSKVLLVAALSLFVAFGVFGQERKTIEVVLGESYTVDLDGKDSDVDFVLTADKATLYDVFMVDSYNSKFNADLSKGVDVGRALWFQVRNGSDYADSYKDRRIYREREKDTKTGTWGGITPERSGPVATFKPENEKVVIYLALYKSEAKYHGSYVVKVMKSEKKK